MNSKYKIQSYKPLLHLELAPRRNFFWSGILLRFSKPVIRLTDFENRCFSGIEQARWKTKKASALCASYVRSALSIGLTFMSNCCYLASVWAIQERNNLGCLFQSVTDTLAVHLWDLLRGEVGSDDGRQLMFVSVGYEVDDGTEHITVFDDFARLGTKVIYRQAIEKQVMSLSVGENVNRWGRKRQSPVTITPIASRENAMR